MFMLRAVHLVNSQIELFTAATKKPGYLFISRQQAFPAIHHKNDSFGFLDGGLDLISDSFEEGILSWFIVTTRINKGKREAFVEN